jgi:hypothetical protein
MKKALRDLLKNPRGLPPFASFCFSNFAFCFEFRDWDLSRDSRAALEPSLQNGRVRLQTRKTT